MPSLMAAPPQKKKKGLGILIAVGPKGDGQDDSPSADISSSDKQHGKSPSTSGFLIKDKPPIDDPYNPKPSSTDPSPSPTTPDPAMPSSNPPPQGGGHEAMADKAVPPEAVSCHTSAENCKGCEYVDPQMFCSWLKMQVGEGSPSDIVYCKLFEPKGGESSEMESAETHMGTESPAMPT